MTITANDVATLHTYANGVMARASHHAGQVKSVTLALLGGIIWRADPGSIEIKQYDGGLANVIWMSVNGHRYALAYNHQTGKIEIRDRVQNGAILHSFDDNADVRDIETVFLGL